MSQVPEMMRATYRNIIIAAIGPALLFAACKKVEPAPQTSPIVEAPDYSAFWLWAGVKPQAVLEDAETVYILYAEYRAASDKAVHILRPAIPQVDGAHIWLVLRVETLNWDDAVYAQLLSRLEQWEARNSLAGLQIDFDAETAGLANYAAFLRDLRARLPARYQLGITGLLDWSANGDPAQLSALSGVVDEIVLQTYQGRETIAGYADYFRNISRLRIPFRIGLVQHGKWRAPPELKAHPYFRGYVIFLVNPPAGHSSPIQPRGAIQLSNNHPEAFSNKAPWRRR